MDGATAEQRDSEQVQECFHEPILPAVMDIERPMPLESFLIFYRREPSFCLLHEHRKLRL